MTLLKTPKPKGSMGCPNVSAETARLAMRPTGRTGGRTVGDGSWPRWFTDIGHMLHDMARDFAERGVDDRHDGGLSWPISKM